MRRGLAWWAAGAWVWAAAVAFADRARTRSLDDVEPLERGPLVSVVVPARDEERAIGATVDALARQGYRELEVVVVDDESRDGTRAAAQ